MKRPLIFAIILQPNKDTFLRNILRRCGTYYRPAELFYQELWKERLHQIGFRVISVEKLPYHHIWETRLCCTLTAQTYLLVSKPLPKRYASAKELLPKQLQSEIQQIAKDLGPPIKSDCINVARSGAYFRVSFIWPTGRPGRLLKIEKRAEAFSFLIRPWLRRNRN